MSTHRSQTDESKRVKLPSSIERVQWADLRAAPGGTVGLEIGTRYVGNGSTLQIKLTDHQGTTQGTFGNPDSLGRCCSTVGSLSPLASGEDASPSKFGWK